MAFDYATLKRVLKELCDALDERVLLPERSPHLRLERQDGWVTAWFADERIPFLERDCLTLPLRNVTIEELSTLLLERLLGRSELAGADIRSMEIGVSSGSGQWAYAQWGKA
jgi:6-pyruvoyltetrahydropterin/6-carboxytetrahydropterin synthase